MYESADESNRPKPRTQERQAEWEETARRHRMLEGKWKCDADRGLRAFFDESTHNFLPPAVLAFNPAKSYAEQTATLYDDDVKLQFVGRKPSKEALRLLNLPSLWAQQQETLVKVRALKDCYICRSWDPYAMRVRYRVVSPDCIDADPSEEDPQQPGYVRHLRQRMVLADGFDPDRKYWCWDEWRMYRDPDGVMRGEFAIVHETGDTRVDITTAIRPDLAAAPGRWPYWSGGALGAGEPIWPWTAYHERVSDALHRPYDGIELVDGTVIVAVLWTFWVGGFRDASFLQRWMMDARLAGVKNQDGQDYVASNPLAVLQLRSVSADRPGSTGQWAAPVDPKASGEAIGNFAAMLALFAGLSPADVSIGNAGLSRTSGFAIEVSRDGKRKIERKLLIPMRMGDQHNLAHAGKLANAYGGVASQLPEDPEAYQPIYTRQGRTTEEIRAQVERVRGLVQEGLLHPAEALQELRPELEREQAEQLAVEIATFKAFLASIAAGAEAEPEAEQALETSADEQPEQPQDDQVEDEQPEQQGGAPVESVQDTALNGAQVQAAADLVTRVGTGELPKAAVEVMLTEFFNLSTDSVRRMLESITEGSQAPADALPPVPPPPPRTTVGADDPEEQA